MPVNNYRSHVAKNRVKDDLSKMGKVALFLRAIKAYSSPCYEYAYQFNNKNPFTWLLKGYGYVMSYYWATTAWQSPKQIRGEIKREFDTPVNREVYPYRVL